MKTHDAHEDMLSWELLYTLVGYHHYQIRVEASRVVDHTDIFSKHLKGSSFSW